MAKCMYIKVLNTIKFISPLLKINNKISIIPMALVVADIIYIYIYIN